MFHVSLLLSVYFRSDVSVWSTRKSSLLLVFATENASECIFHSNHEAPKAGRETVKACQRCSASRLGDPVLLESASTPPGNYIILSQNILLVLMISTHQTYQCYTAQSRLWWCLLSPCRTDQFNTTVRPFLSWPLTSADSSYVATQWKVIKRVVVLRAWCSRSRSVVTRYS